MDNTRILPPQQGDGNVLTRRLIKSNLRPVVLFSMYYSSPMALGD